MDEDVETKINQFLKSFINPDEKDIKDFAESLIEEQPSIDLEELILEINKISEIYAQQSTKLYKIEEKFSDFSDMDNHEVSEFKQILQRAYDKNSEIIDVSEEINNLNSILESLQQLNIRESTFEFFDEDNILDKIKDLSSESLETEELDDIFDIGDESIQMDEEVVKDETEISKPEIKSKGPVSSPDILDILDAGMGDYSDLIKDDVDSEVQSTKTSGEDTETGRKFVKELMEEKLVSDVEARIKTIKEHQELTKQSTKLTLKEKIRTHFSKDIEELEEYDPDKHGPLVSFDGLDKHDEIERYWVNEPCAFIVILNNNETNEKLYYVVEPKLTPFEDLFLKEIKDRLRNVLLVEDIIPEGDKETVLTNKVKEMMRDYAIDLNPVMLQKILYYVIRDYVHFGLIDAMQNDDRIEDCSCNGHDVPIYLYHKQYLNIGTNIVFKQDDLDSFIIRLAQRSGKHISVAEPMIDATMPDGSRIQMTLSTHVTAHGGTFTIRKFAEVPLTPIDLIIWGTFSSETMAYLWLCIENNKSLIFAGGTASGKTSSLNAVSLFIPRQAKVISLEDTRELKLPHPNWIPAVTRDAFTADQRGAIDMYELLRAALRQRPEYLLVGEVRGKEALTLFQAMSTGHTTFSTMHADSVASAIHRLENPPISVPRTMIQALNIISIQTQTYHKGKRVRRNTKLVEITDIDPQTRNIRTNDIFSWESMTDRFQRVGESKALNDIMTTRAMNQKEIKRELIVRQKILDFLAMNNITEYNTISTIIYEYSINPEKVLKKLKIIE
jgi:flagellar protein FlaI